jgi:uncharacterized membrane protein YhaH (DUF805 family)
MSNSVAIILGILAGAIGFIPIFVAIRISRHSTSTSVMSAAACGLLGSLVSLIVVVVELLLCSQLAHDVLLPFGIAELLALIVVTATYVVYKNVLAKRK